MSEKIDFESMNDKDYEGYLMKQFFEGGGMDFDAMDEAQKSRLMKYIQSEDTQPQGAPPGAAQAMQVGMSQGQAPNMSQPQQTGLPGLMGMATQGIQRVPNRPMGLMGK